MAQKIMGTGFQATGIKALGITAALAALAACSAPDPFEVAALPKGEPLNIRDILAAHPNKRACVQYEAATNSCSSMITSTVQGNMMISHERAAVKVPGGTQVQHVEVVTRSTLIGMKACVRSSDVAVTGRDQMSEVLLGATRDLVAQFGGSVCGTYFRAGNGYIVSNVGANGQAYPPGDQRFQFITGEAKLRAK